MNTRPKIQRTEKEVTFKCGDKTIRLPVRDAKVVGMNLHRSVRAYERRYEITSAEMARRLKTRSERETIDTLRWMQKYHALRLISPTTHTIGTRMTTIVPFTKNE